MNWPQAQDYQEAVQNPQQVFAEPDLQHAEVVCNKLGLPAPYSGSAAVVYHLHSPDGQRHWAVKCFTRPVCDLQQRYRDISAHLHRVDLPFTVGFQYLEQGIYLRENWYPVLKMDWVEGQTFQQFLAERLEQTRLLQALCPMWLRLAQRMVETRVVHGDLQHGNVLWVPGSNERRLALKLVDYDGMWVPELAGLPMTEQGHEAYQHPQREHARTVTPEMDRFSHLVIYGALRCLALGGRPLWERYHDGNNLLFKKEDFRYPRESDLLQKLWDSEVEELRWVAGHLVQAATEMLEKVPLLEKVLSGEEFRPLNAADQQKVEVILRGQVIGRDEEKIEADTVESVPEKELALEEKKPTSVVTWPEVVSGELLSTESGQRPREYAAREKQPSHRRATTSIIKLERDLNSPGETLEKSPCPEKETEPSPVREVKRRKQLRKRKSAKGRWRWLSVISRELSFFGLSLNRCIFILLGLIGLSMMVNFFVPGLWGRSYYTVQPFSPDLPADGSADGEIFLKYGGSVEGIVVTIKNTPAGHIKQKVVTRTCEFTAYISPPGSSTIPSKEITYEARNLRSTMRKGDNEVQYEIHWTQKSGVTSVICDGRKVRRAWWSIGR